MKIPFFTALVPALASPCFSYESRNLNDTKFTDNADREVERRALVTLYEETNGTQWLRQGGWLNASYDHCYWEGVSCGNGTGLVTSLELAENSMDGSLPSLRNLEFLTFVNLSHNKLWGSLEDVDVENLRDMQYLSLAENSFNGTLGEISKSLTFLDLSRNKIDGTVEPSPGGTSNLTYLNLADNNIVGINVTQLTQLRQLDLSGNPSLSQPFSGSGINKLLQLVRLNLAGTNFSGPLNISSLVNLTLLDLSNNKLLYGSIEDTGILNMTELQYCDLSGGGQFNGTFNFTNLTALEHLNLEGVGVSGNLTGIGNLTSLRTLILGSNVFHGPISELANLTSLEYLDLRRNDLSGDLYAIQFLSQVRQLHLEENRFNSSIPDLPTSLSYLNLSHNTLVGTIPDLSELELLERLDLSNQHVSNYDSASGDRIAQGISGVIPSSIARLYFLQELVLSNNLLTGTIPEVMGRLAYIRVIDLEDNQIGSLIPSSFGILEQLDSVLLARNRLQGPIPTLGASIEKIRTVTLEGNPGLDAPAPFELCDLDDLDLRRNALYCPPQRSALASFYVATKGAEWNNNTNWIDPEKHHCSWYGVGCREDNSEVVSLTLNSNGVSGRIPSELFSLSSLESLDLNDNDIRGRVPTEIGRLNQLKKLRLSYNLLTGLPGGEFENLKNLSLLHLQGNRITGDDSHITLADDDAYNTGHKFISDCGDPTDAESPFICDGCDMCCNSLEECQEPLSSRYSGYESAGIVIASVFAFCCVSYIFVQVLVRINVLAVSGTSAVKACGEESVYSFFLTKSIMGWLVAISTLLIQVLIFGLFLQASSFDTDISDFVYSWRCPRNTEECNDERTVSAYGWTMWGLLVFASLTDDLASGIKLLYLAASRSSAPCFTSGVMLFSITVLAIWTSAVYNRAIAMSNTELIVNAVILLFVNDIDEQIYNICRVTFLKWTRDVASQAESFSTDLQGKRCYGCDAGEKRDEKSNKLDVSDKSNEQPPIAINEFYETEPMEERDDTSRLSFVTAIERSASQRTITNDQHDALLLKIANLEHEFLELQHTMELQSRRMVESSLDADGETSCKPIQDPDAED